MPNQPRPRGRLRLPPAPPEGTRIFRQASLATTRALRVIPSVLWVPPPGIWHVWRGAMAVDRLRRLDAQLWAPTSKRVENGRRLGGLRVFALSPPRRAALSRDDACAMLGADPTYGRFTKRFGKPYHVTASVPCRTCGNPAALLVLRPDHRGWACRTCLPVYIRPDALTVAECCFAMRLGLPRRFWNDRYRDLVTLGVRLASSATTPEHLALLAAVATLTTWPRMNRAGLVRVPSTPDEPGGVRPYRTPPQPWNAPRTAFWRTLRPWFLQAYVDTCLHPDAWLARTLAVLPRPML